MSEVAVATHGLTKRFGDVVALDDVDLVVPSGVVFGCLGPNGAGKTTLLRILVGLLRPTHGAAEVLGNDCVREAVRVHARVGYLPGDFAAYPDLTGEQYLGYLGSLRGGIDWSRVEVLAKRLDLDLHRRIGTLSHGNRQKVGLLQAFMHDPDLLVLDEPTSGLDPLVQQEFRAMVGEARDAGRTVLLSSHVMAEVEAVADLVGILRQGRIVAVDRVDRLKEQLLRRITLTFADAVPEAELTALPNVRDLQVVGHLAILVAEGSTEDLFRVSAPHGIVDVDTHEADLEDVFLAHYA